jgi:hypothetical protein
MNGNLKSLTVILGVFFSIGGLVWGASTLSNQSTRNAQDVTLLRVEQRQSRDDMTRIREDLAGIKAQVTAQTELLKSIQLELRLR